MSKKITSIISEKVAYYQQQYFDLFHKYAKRENKLFSAILYSFNVLTIDDFELLYTLPNRLLIKKNTEEFDKIVLSCILNFLSMKIIYTLPHMLNKRIQNKSICVHVIYGESITQLVSFCLLLERLLGDDNRAFVTPQNHQLISFDIVLMFRCFQIRLPKPIKLLKTRIKTYL